MTDIVEPISDEEVRHLKKLIVRHHGPSSIAILNKMIARIRAQNEALEKISDIYPNTSPALVSEFDNDAFEAATIARAALHPQEGE